MSREQEYKQLAEIFAKASAAASPFQQPHSQQMDHVMQPVETTPGEWCVGWGKSVNFYGGTTYDSTELTIKQTISEVLKGISKCYAEMADKEAKSCLPPGTISVF